MKFFLQEEEDDPTSPVPKGSSSRKSTIERKVSYDPPQSPEKEAGSTLKRSPKSAKGTDDLDDKVCISKRSYFDFNLIYFLVTGKDGG